MARLPQTLPRLKGATSTDQKYLKLNKFKVNIESKGLLVESES